MKCDFLSSIADIDAETWNGVLGNDYPFMRHEFLAAMEQSGSACEKTGWQPYHLIVYDGNDAIAVMPLYLKFHSYGEYIFDWSWADAYQRIGLAYYPKLLSAIPFTPATGPRLAIVNSADKTQVQRFAAQSLVEYAHHHQLSSIHILAANADESTQWSTNGFQPRTTVQYHWSNNNYKDFNHYLSYFSSRKRKNINKERQSIHQKNIEIKRLIGNQITTQQWDIFYHFYQMTYAKRSGHGGYLSRDFFQLISQSMPQQVMLVLTKHNGDYVAGALYFFSSTTLFGRYWGCIEEFNKLHFECCYYQGIDFCIERGLKTFDAGAQGEHKIQRGFVPLAVHSNHWIRDARFAQAIGEFIDKETQHHADYIHTAKTQLPFKKNAD